jgi:hypothetical protein
MNISHKELCDLYQRYIEGKHPLSRKNCPPIVKLINFFEPKTSKKSKTKIIEHITRCASCARDFECILNLKRSVKDFNHEIALLINSQIKQKNPRNDPRPYIFHYQSFWKYAVSVASLIFLVICLFIVLNKIPDTSPSKELNRGNLLPQVRLIEPIHGIYTKNHLVFRWEKYQDTEYYIIEIFDETMALVWRSSKITELYFSFPEEIKNKLSAPNVYYWMVLAHTRNLGTIESPLVNFHLLQ